MWEPFARRAWTGPLIAFDAPGTGRSPRATPLRMRGLARARRAGCSTRSATTASTRSATRSAARWCRSSRTGRPSACAGSCCARPRRGSARVPPKPVAGPAARHARPLLPPGAAALDGAAHRRRADAARPVSAARAGRRAARARAQPARLRVPALRRGRLEQPSVAAPPAHADAGRRRRRRPRDPARQRAPAGAPDPRRAAARRRAAAGTSSCSTSRTRRPARFRPS